MDNAVADGTTGDHHQGLAAKAVLECNATTVDNMNITPDNV